ncbi:MAG: PRC-barrel domain-containing protein [Luteolibacter sp.]
MNPKNLLFFLLLPLLSPLTAFAEPDASPEKINARVMDTKDDQRLATAWRASEVIGTNVKNTANETIGEVKDLVLDLKAGELIAVVVSSGGFLGIADTLSSIPPSALQFDGQTKSFKTSLTKEQLQKAPQHKSTERPDYSDSTVMAKLRDYRDSIGGDVKAPDNSANNEVDAKEDTVTPMDQGNSDSDLKTTKDIRAAIVAADLSFNAKNIKIVTKDGHVTLRGVVNNSAEHGTVLKLVRDHVDSTKITDSLSVK